MNVMNECKHVNLTMKNNYKIQIKVISTGMATGFDASYIQDYIL